ncbi:MAG: polymerase subunit alpha, Gram-positive type [Bacillota bacterium]|jgi:DNA polymerase-3 subunit alpha (Gram-positive type)|nr:polymerase subunit alpha, Gram-positive type [Bacillota bacterium]
MINKEGLSWQQLVERLAVDQELKNMLLVTSLAGVTVSPDGRHWVLTLQGPCALPAASLHKVEEAVTSLAPSRPAVKIEFIRRETVVDVGAVWPAITAELIREMPFLHGWLENADWELADGVFSLRLGNRFAAHLFNERGGAAVLRNLLAAHTGSVYQVEVVGEEGGEPPQFETQPEDELKQYIEEIQEAARKESPAGGGENTSEVVTGEPISAAPVPLAELRELGSSVVVEGWVTQAEVQKTKKGKTLLAFDLADETDAVSVKVLLKKKAEEEAAAQVGPGRWLRVKGELTFDRFAGEESIWARAIQLVPPREDSDPAPVKRVELHLHTQMSALDATTKLKDLFATLARWQHTAVAITDHGSVQAFPEAYELGRQYGIKVIYGLEGYLVEDGVDPLDDKARVYHIVVLVRNQTGLKNLYQLVTLSHLDYFHRVPRLPRSVLEKYREGLIFGSACEAGEVFQALLGKADEAELRRRAAFYDYLEIQPRGNNAFLLREGRLSESELLALNRRLVALGQEVGRPVVATGDVHFLRPADEVLRRILLAGQKYSDADLQPPLYLKKTEEMLAEFSYLGADTAREVVVEAPRRLAAQVEEVQPVPSDLSAPRIPGAENEIAAMARRRATELYGDPLPEVVAQRLEKELRAIISNGFAVIYLIAQRLVKKSLEDGYLVGSRGSVGSSLVATLCGITEVNPLPPHYRCPECRYSKFVAAGTAGSGFDLPTEDCPRCGHPLIKDGQDIPFETFLGFKGDKVPDIDLNFSGEYQGRIHRYTEELFGHDHVFRAGTISTIAERTAYGFVKAYADQHGLKWRRAQMDRLVAGLTGVRRTTGQHPGGLMIVPDYRDILDFTPVQHPADAKESDVVTTHFDYHSISSRLLKLDLLGHDDPTVLKMLEELTGVNPRSVPLDDPATLALFSGVEPLGVKAEDIGSEVGTIGLPEFGTRFVRQMLVDTRPTSFSELVRISGLSHGTDVWLGNAQELIKSGRATLAEVICTRDDIMLYLISRGLEPSLAFKTMESVRKGKGLKPEMEEAMVHQGVPEWYIASCRKIKYMFPKAHAVAYVMMAFRIAYFKVHYPAAFYATYFSVRADDFDLALALKGPEAVAAKIAELEAKGNEAAAKEKGLLTVLEVAREMFARGLRFLPLDLSRSHPTRFLITPDGLLPPLVSLPGLGQAAALNIVAAREERPFSSQEDLKRRARLPRSLITLLAQAGCLEKLPANDQLDLFQALP